jgi:hypothetical protein
VCVRLSGTGFGVFLVVAVVVVVDGAAQDAVEDEVDLVDMLFRLVQLLDDAAGDARDLGPIL